ncbi:MAG: FAD:protein FMN transferase [Epulopiscium sp.]|nr:FAD:protein FMN transferase [Candidatus Epulonipiscium sp.]
MKKNIFLMLLITIIAILSGCASNKGKNTVIKEEIYALGTVIQIQIYDADEEKAKKAIEESEKRVQEIENKMTVNKEKSEVILINENSGINSVQVSPDTFYVIQKAKKYSDLSGGAFDLTVEPIVKLWGIGTENARVPKQEEIDALLGLVDYNDVVLDESTNQVKLNREGQAIDLGAIAKGYAGDEVKKILKEHGIKTAFVNLGGNVVTLGSKLDGSPWRIGVQNPLDERGKHIAVIEVVDETLVTSGNYERYFIEDGKRYHHIIDPKTGYPAEAGIISSTIVTNSSIDADALSTSVYVLGLEKGMELIESLENVEAVIVTEDKKIYVTSGLKERFKLENEEFQLAN